MAKHDILLNQFKLNDKLHLKNRIIMAPMTRAKAASDFTPTQAMTDYYSKRADAGLIITEGTVIRPDAVGYPNVPGIYTQKHIDGWAKVTRAVHQKGGKIFLQLWHVGRVSHPFYLNDELPISPSATTMVGRVRRAQDLYYGKSRALMLDEIKQLIRDYVSAAENAMAAGFDGVEIHGANGFLIDQFLHYDTNRRTDEYGKTPENMARFALEIVKAVSEAIGQNHVGLRLSPGAYLNEIRGDIRDAEVFKYLLEQLNDLDIAYVHTGAFDDSELFSELGHQSMTQFMRNIYRGNIIATGSYSFEKAQAGISNCLFNLVAMGRPFIANPDLIQRLTSNQAIKPYAVEMLQELR